MFMTSEQVIANLKQHASAQAIDGMARFGIRPIQALGISIPTLRKIAKEIGRNQVLALELWDSGIQEKQRNFTSPSFLEYGRQPHVDRRR
jgi:3-methyladenine DNA glycosylase AlkD